MDESLKKQAYSEAQKLKRAGYDAEVIFARLEKQGIPEDLAKQVIQNLYIQQKIDTIKAEKPNYNIGLIRIGIGVLLAIVTAILIPGQIYLPIGLIAGGVIAAVVAKKKMES